MEEKISVPGARYQQVAADIAAKIVDRQYQVGEKIYARSLIASQYSVSSETARRAIAILSDLGIVESVKGSGVQILSYEKALQFLKRFRDVETLSQLKRDTFERLDLLERESVKLRESLTRMVDHSDRFRAFNPLTPLCAVVRDGSPSVGKNLADLDFWQNTAATVVALRRGPELILSPGPAAELQSGDMIYFIGEDDCVERVARLLECGPPDDSPQP